MLTARVSIIIPALNEEAALPIVLAEIRRVISGIQAIERSEIIVADNGSIDRTAQLAQEAGATVVTAHRRGYGSACLRALAAISIQTNVVVFMDGDHSDYAEDLPALLDPILSGAADFVIGARRDVTDGALTLQQRFGNRLACTLIRWLYGFRYTDLGPFRVIRRDILQALGMRDPAFGWTVEMQIKAIKKSARILEVPVRYRPRIGESKISGTILGSLRAGQTILWTIAKSAAW
jgi:glycosyltransferase involved in cell wall biosynthesis